MRRFDRSFANFPNIEDERRVAVPNNDDRWLRSSLEQLATTQNKLRVNVSQNSENIVLCRKENVAVAENLRTAATMWQQFGEKVSRLADQMDYERDSMESVANETNQKVSSLAGQYRQLMSGGVQVERNLARLEEEVLILKQNNEQTNKKIQGMNEKINDVMQQLNKLNNAMEIGIQDLRQLNHQTEISTKKSVRSMMQDIEHKIENEEQERREDTIKVIGKLSSLEAIVQELKKAKRFDAGNYAALLEEKDQEYKAELKNFLKKIKNHVDDQRFSGNSTGLGLTEDAGKRLRAIEKRLEREEQERTEGLRRLEEETAKHFKRVSGHIIQQLDSLGSSLTGNSPGQNMQQELAEMRKEIEENKKSIDRVLRAEIAVRKSQAQKINDSIEGFEKHSNKSAVVLKEAITEMKIYVDKELEAKSYVSNDVIIPKLDKRLSDVEEKLIRRESESKRPVSLNSQLEKELLEKMERRLSDLDKKLINNEQILGKGIKTNKESIKEIFPLVEKRLSDAEIELKEKHEKCKSPETFAWVKESLEQMEARLSSMDKTPKNKIHFEQTPESFAGVKEYLEEMDLRLSELDKKSTNYKRYLEKTTESFSGVKVLLKQMEGRLREMDEKTNENKKSVDENKESCSWLKEGLEQMEGRLKELGKNENDNKLCTDQTPESYSLVQRSLEEMEARLSELAVKSNEHERYFEKEIKSNKETINDIMPLVEQRLSDAEMKFVKMHDDTYQQSSLSDKDSATIMPYLESRLSDIEEKLKQQSSHSKSPTFSDELTHEKIFVLEGDIIEVKDKIKEHEKRFQRSFAKEGEYNKEMYLMEKKITDLKERFTEYFQSLQKSTLSDKGNDNIIPLVESRLTYIERKLKEQNNNIKSPTDEQTYKKIYVMERELTELNDKIEEHDKKLQSSYIKEREYNKELYLMERKLTDLQEKVIKQNDVLKVRNSKTWIKECEPDVARRLSRLEDKLKWQMSMIMTMEKNRQKQGNIDSKERIERSQTADFNRRKFQARPPQIRRNSSFLKVEVSSIEGRNNQTDLSRDRLHSLEQKMRSIIDNQDDIENDVAVLQRRSKREIMIERRIRNKLVEFVNKRCMEGQRIPLFIKHFGVHHLKYFMDYTGKTILLNKWGMYQALRMFEIKKRWLGLIGKKPLELTLKEYREMIREEREKERERARKEQKKKPVSPIIFDTESSESEPEAEPEPETNDPAAEDKEAENEEPVASENEEEKPKEPEGPVRINYEDDNSGDDYIQYRTDDDDDETDDEFFPQTSEDEEDSKLFSDEDEDDEDDTAEEEDNEEEEKDDKEEEEKDDKEEDNEDDEDNNEVEDKDGNENEDENDDENEGENEDENEAEYENEDEGKSESDDENEEHQESDAENDDDGGNENDDDDEENQGAEDDEDEDEEKEKGETEDGNEENEEESNEDEGNEDGNDDQDKDEEEKKEESEKEEGDSQNNKEDNDLNKDQPKSNEVENKRK